MSLMSVGGDMSLTATLSTQDVEQALARLEGITQQSANRIAGIGDRLHRSFFGLNRIGFAAIAGVTASYGMARKAMLEYADKNDEVKSQIQTLSTVWGRVWDNIGRDTANSGVLEYLTDVGRLLEEFQDGLQTKTSGQLTKDSLRSVLVGHGLVTAFGPAGLSGMLGMYGKASLEAAAAAGSAGGGSGANEYRRAQEEQSRLLQHAVVFGMLEKKARIHSLRLSGDNVGAAEVSVELAREEAEQEATRRFPDARDGVARSAYVSLAVRMAQDELLKVRAEESAAKRRRLADAEESRLRPLLDAERDVRERNERWERNRVLAEADAGFTERSARIALMRAEGREREAAAAAITLRYDRERSAIELDEGLSEFDKAPILEAIERARGLEQRALERGDIERVVGARSLGGGLAGSGIDSMVFGGGPKMNDAQRELLNVQKTAAETLKRIEQKIGAGAVYN